MKILPVNVENDETSETGELHIRKRRFVDAILAGSSVKEASLSVGVTATTGYKWLKMQAVRLAVQEGQTLIHEEGIRKLKHNFDMAIDTMIELCDKKYSGHVRQKAASDILRMVIENEDKENISSRMEAIEDYIEASTTGIA